MSDQSTITNTNPSMENTNRSLAWLLPVLLLLGFLVYYFMQGNRLNAPTTDNSTVTPPPATQNRPVNNVSDINNARTGQSANLSRITIRSVIGNRIFTIGNIGGKPLYIVVSSASNQNASGITLQEGQQVNLNGTIVSTKGDEINRLGLTQSELQALSGQDIVLVVDEIRVDDSAENQQQDSAQTQSP